MAANKTVTEEMRTAFLHNSRCGNICQDSLENYMSPSDSQIQH